MVKITIAAMITNTVAMGTLTVGTKTIAVTVAAHGGNTFQTHMFSTVYTAFDVAVIRLVSIPGIRSVKQLGAWPVKWRDRARRTSPLTATKAKLAIQLAIRQSKLSAAIKDTSTMNAPQTPLLDAPPASASTRNFTAYCVPTEQPTAARTKTTIVACDSDRRRT